MQVTPFPPRSPDYAGTALFQRLAKSGAQAAEAYRRVFRHDCTQVDRRGKCPDLALQGKHAVVTDGSRGS
jgi:hypothetical protein